MSFPFIIALFLFPTLGPYITNLYYLIAHPQISIHSLSLSHYFLEPFLHAFTQ
jgi:hypothetical protein